MELSFRVWLCGGEIRLARESIIGHAYREELPSAALLFSWSCSCLRRRRQKFQKPHWKVYLQRMEIALESASSASSDSVFPNAQNISASHEHNVNTSTVMVRTAKARALELGRVNTVVPAVYVGINYRAICTGSFGRGTTWMPEPLTGTTCASSALIVSC